MSGGLKMYVHVAWCVCVQSRWMVSPQVELQLRLSKSAI